MCGVPFHAADGYITRLIRQGFSVAICDQVEDPKTAKGLVKREVTRVVTPGTLTDAAYLDARAPALLAAVLPPGKGSTTWGLAWVELSTGDFAATEFDGESGAALLREELGVLAAARGAAARGRGSRPAAGRRHSPARRDAPRAVAVLARRGAARPDRAVADDRAGRVRPGRPSVCHRRRRRARPVPARHAEGRPDTRPQPRLSRDARRPDHRRHDAAPPRGPGLDRGRPPGVAARRARRDGHGDGRAPAARLAHEAAGRARRHPRPPRRRRGPRLQVDRARQPARHPRGGARRPAPRRPCGAGHRRAARPRRAGALAGRRAWPAPDARHAAGAAARAAVRRAR